MPIASNVPWHAPNSSVGGFDGNDDAAFARHRTCSPMKANESCEVAACLETCRIAWMGFCRRRRACRGPALAPGYARRLWLSRYATKVPLLHPPTPPLPFIARSYSKALPLTYFLLSCRKRRGKNIGISNRKEKKGKSLFALFSVVNSPEPSRITLPPTLSKRSVQQQHQAKQKDIATTHASTR